MNISQIFVERPIATSLLMAAILLFGLVAYQSLPVSDLPNIDFPTLLITATLPGANPETMASAVATPLENQFSTIAGLNSMTSVNSLGATLITLEFDLSRSLDGSVPTMGRDLSQAPEPTQAMLQARRTGAAAAAPRATRAHTPRRARVPRGVCPVLGVRRRALPVHDSRLTRSAGGLLSPMSTRASAGEAMARPAARAQSASAATSSPFERALRPSGR